MRTIGKMAMAFGLVAAMSAPAMAQGGRGFGGGFGGGGMLLTNKGVQQELKVTDDQASKLSTLAEEQRSKGAELRSKLQDLSQDERREKMAEYQRTNQAEMHKSLGTILKPEQHKRFNQIQTQVSGVQAFSTPRIQEALKLTDDQKSKIADINREYMESSRDSFQNLQNASDEERQAAMKKRADMSKAAVDKVAALLSADQKNTWKDLTGDPFEYKFERPQN